MIAAIVAMFIMQSCAKEEGVGGKKEINGTVSYTGGTAGGAIIYIAYGTKDATSDFDFSTVADDNGKYTFPALEVGDYFIDAEYTDDNGFEFNTAGYGVTIGEKKGELEVNIMLE